MTYGRERFEGRTLVAQGAAVSHLAELVRGEFLSSEGPLIQPFGPPSPQGEKGAVARFGAHCDRRAWTKPDLERFT